MKAKLGGLLPDGGEMGALARALDWSATKLGAIASWPQSLRTAVNIVLEAKFPMMIAWGQDFTQFYNDPFRPILGSSKHPALGKSARDTYPEAWHIVGPLFDQVMRGDAVRYDDMLVPLNRHGYLEECFFLYSYSPIRDESGGVGGLLVTVAETTARVVAERRLRALRDLGAGATQLHAEADAWKSAGRTLAENPADVPFAFLYVLAPDGRTARLAAPRAGEWSPAVVALDAADDSAWPLSRVAASQHPEVVADVRARFGDHAGEAWPEPVETALVLPVTRAGHDRPYGILVAGISPRRALDDKYRDFLILAAEQIATSIATTRALEDEKKRADALVELDRAKTVFFSNVSHELRTPLTLLLGPTEELLRPDSALAAAERAKLEVVQRNARRLQRLVSTLLDFARIEGGREQAFFAATDLNTLTRELAATFRSVIEQGGLRFDVECHAAEEPVYVDPAMWEKIVFNLLSNAFKFTLSGSISLTLREGGDHVALAVRDTGAGIPAAELPHLFERFHRVEGTRARTHEGTGIGLALMRDLVRFHGGEVHVTSTEGAGSVFTVSIPRGTAHVPPERIRDAGAASPIALRARAYVDEMARWVPSAPAPAAASERAGGAGGRDRILVADDNADMRDYISAQLIGSWDIETVANGVEALAAARREPPALVLTDVMMPQLDGYGLLQALRDDPKTAAVPVILLSARAGDESLVAGFTKGADDYLVKPFSAKELIARVATHVELGRLRSAAETERRKLLALMAEREALFVEREQLLARERQARRDAESGSRAKDEFLAMLGHELRNPLAPISAALQLLRLRGGDGEERELTVIDRQVKHLTSLVDDLLDVSRITSGKIELKRELVEMGVIVERAIEIASPLIEQRSHHLSVDVPAAELAVHGDLTRLAQVVSNLLTNAAKYTERGGQIRVAAALRDGAVELCVADNGGGIAGDVLPHVFDLFVQERQAIDRNQGGLGLGLAIVRSLVAMHEGSVAAASPGRGLGSTFTIRLPHRSSELSGGEAAPAPRRAGPKKLEGAPSVLVVDDNVDGAELLAMVMAERGCDVRVAHDGPSALALVQTFRPAMALLDIGLPVMDGYELARRLRERPDMAGACLVAVTGYGQRDDVKRARDAGFDHHVVKPVDLRKIDELLALALPRKA